MKLIIVESPAKARKIRSLLGSSYAVEASVGHVREIPKRGLNIDVKNGFEPVFEISEGKQEVVKKIKGLAKKADVIYLASDPDREGEAIAQHIHDLLPKSDQKKCSRISYDQITKAAIEAALAKPRDIDQDLVAAQKARQVLDRLIGYKASPLLWFGVGKGTSAGRVQSIALQIICDRQKEIDAFIPEDYWHVDAMLKCNNGQFWARVFVKGEKDNRFKDEAEAKKALADVKASTFKIKTVERSKRTFKPSPPFDTTSLQTTCSSILKWGATKTMMVAQSLYTDGHVSYIRTDSYNVAPEAMAEVRGTISECFGSNYLPEKSNVYVKKSTAAAQEAHECIRPTHLSFDGEGLSSDDRTMYRLIHDRFVASQMTPMILDVVKYEVAASKGRILVAAGNAVEFDGFSRVWDYSRSGNDQLPNANDGDELSLSESKCTKHTTKPPDRYNDGSLVKQMEDLGIGRPSTRASIIKTLEDRTYVKRDKQALVPLPVGHMVCDFLKPAFKDFFMDTGFTADLEDRLDAIAAGKENFLEVVSSVYDKLKERIKDAKNTKADRKTFGKCPECGEGQIEEKVYKGRVFYGCNAHPACKATFTRDGDVFSAKAKAKKLDRKCPDCGKQLVERQSSYGKFVGCSGYPKCRHKES